MRFPVKIFFAALAVALSAGCDDGKIYPQEETATGRQVSGTFRLTSLDAFPTGDHYQLVFAAFGESGDYPASYRLLAKPASESAATEVTLGNVGDNISYVALSVIDKSKKLVHHFMTFDLAGDSDDSVVLPEKTVDLASYDRMQDQLFTSQCIACHGGSNMTAAGLSLTASESYGMLVGTASTVDPSSKRATPGSPSQSFLYRILTVRELLGTDHTEMVENEDIALIKCWIENGCPE